MNLIDIFIGATLMNAMPHFILGVWRAKMLSGFGLGSTRNILWGLTNFIISVSLYIYTYSLHALLENGIYFGALAVIIIFFFTAPFWYQYYHKKSLN